MNRMHQVLLLASFLPLCWLGMMAVHEFGHVLGAWTTGGVVQKVVIHPLAISRTDVEPNYAPLLVAWAGPLIGVTLPLLLWSVLAMFRVPGSYLARFFAGFCLIANGCYIGVGSFESVGDAGDLLRHGTSMPVLWFFGVVTLAIGVGLWHRLGAHFGLDRRGKVDVWAAYASLSALVVTLVIALVLSPRS